MAELIKKSDMERLRDTFRNGAPEWLVLRLIVENKGTLSNSMIMRCCDAEFQNSLRKPHLSRARRNLGKNGLTATRTAGGVYYEMDYELEEEYRKFFGCADRIIKLLEERKDKSDLNRLQKNGKVKRT